jgi:hypothetical protein
MFVVGLGGVVGGLFLTWSSSPEHLSSNAGKILICGCLLVVLAPALALIRLVTGPGKPVTLQAYPGRLRADRYISGDHVASEYGAGQVLALFVDGGLLYVETPVGQSPLIGFGKDEVNQVIAIAIAMRLWHPRELSVKNSGRGMTKRTVILPVSGIDSNHASK